MPRRLRYREGSDVAWEALRRWLVWCVEYDTTNRAAAESTRKAAWNLGEESGNTEVMA
jgi:hypothetical protein